VPITGELYAFTDEDIDRAQIYNGVYALYNSSVETIYIGKAEGENGIRGRLQVHKRGDEGQCTQQALFYRFEVCSDPAGREEILLLEFELNYGELPPCNEGSDE